MSESIGIKCCHCKKELTAEEVQYYIVSCENCESKQLYDEPTPTSSGATSVTQSSQTLVERLKAVRINHSEDCHFQGDEFHCMCNSADHYETIREVISQLEAQQAEIEQARIDKVFANGHEKAMHRFAEECEQLRAELASLRGLVPVEAIREAIVAMKYNAEHAQYRADNSTSEFDAWTLRTYVKEQRRHAEALEQFLAVPGQEVKAV